MLAAEIGLRLPLLIVGEALALAGLATALLACDETASHFMTEPHGPHQRSVRRGALVVMGVGTGLAYPVLIAAAGDSAPPARRAAAIGHYRFWRDLGFVVGGLGIGFAADIVGTPAALRVLRGAGRCRHLTARALRAGAARVRLGRA